MGYAIFLHSVHGELPPINYGPIIRNAQGHIVPRPIRGVPFIAVPLNKQIEAAEKDPASFVHALNLLRPRQKPIRPKVFCPDVYSHDRCINGIFCKFAGNLAQLYAHNIVENPYYKTKVCKYEHCKKGAACKYGHIGDLMRRISIVNDRVFTDSWYIRRR